MATPPGGPSPYGNGRDHRSQDARSPAASGAESPYLNRFNFPSAPSEYVQPPQQPQPQQPAQQQPPQQPRNPQHSRIQPVQPAHRGAASAARRGDQQSHQPQQPLVRPYAMTGGRTRPRYQLAIEALVHTTAAPAQLQGQLPEHQRICRLCYEIKSVAEISALLTIPLGVARILVADLAEAGLVAIHQPGGDETSADGQPDVTLLERVLSGLRKL